MAVTKILAVVDTSFVNEKSTANVKKKITDTVNNVKNANRELAGLFFALCKRFTTTDSHSASNFENLINQLPNKAGDAVVYRLQEFSNNGFTVEKVDGKVTIKTVKDGENKFNKATFESAVDNAISDMAASSVLSLPSTKTDEEKRKEKQARDKKALEKLAAPKTWKENLEVYLQSAITNIKNNADISEEAFKLEVEKVLESVFNNERPPIEAEAVEPEQAKESEAKEQAPNSQV